MENDREYEIRNILEDKFKKDMETLVERNERKSNEIREKRLTGFKKISLRRDINVNLEKSKLYNEMMRIISITAPGYKENVSLSDVAKESLEKLSPYFSEDERISLMKFVNDELIKVSKENCGKNEGKYKELIKLMKKVGIGNKYVVDPKSAGPKSCVKCVEELISEDKLNKYDYFVLGKSGEIKPFISVEYQSLFDDLEKIKLSGNYDKKDKNFKKIMDSLSSLKLACEEKTYLEEYNMVLSSAMSSLSREENLDLSNAISMLNKIEQQNNKRIEKLKKVLSLLDYSNVKSIVAKANEDDANKQNEKSAQLEYANLAYQLEELVEQDGYDNNRKNELQAQMREVAVTYGMSNAEISTAYQTGKEKYFNAKTSNEYLKRAIKEDVEEEAEIKSEIANAERKEAESQIQDEGFNEEYEFINGDIRSTDSKQSAIEKRIVANREVKNNAENEKVNTIYKDYVIFRAKNKENPNVASFRQFIEMQHVEVSEDAIQDFEEKGAMTR